MNIWDNYGNWDEIAQLPEVDAVKAKITGNKKAWRPNYCPSSLAYVFDYASDEYKLNYGSAPVAVDFGCGLARNGPLLQKFFPEVVGIDRPDMLNRLITEYPSISSEIYRSLYESSKDLSERERFCVLYDSVVFQHIHDTNYLGDLIDTLSSVEPFRTFVSIHNFREHRRPPHVGVLENKGWAVWHTETETLSFEGALHSIIVFRRW